MGVRKSRTPRKEVLEGDLEDAIFAADFGDLIAGDARAHSSIVMQPRSSPIPTPRPTSNASSSASLDRCPGRTKAAQPGRVTANGSCCEAIPSRLESAAKLCRRATFRSAQSGMSEDSMST